MKQDDPQFKLRLKPDLKEKLEGSARDNTRTLGAEIVARLEASYVPAADSALVPALVRLERDVARFEVDREFDLSLIRMLVMAVKTLSAKRSVDGVQVGGVPLAQWVQLAEGRISKQGSVQEGEAAFARLRSAEVAVRDLLPEAADPIWEGMATMRATVNQLDADASAPQTGRKPKP